MAYFHIQLKILYMWNVIVKWRGWTRHNWYFCFSLFKSFPTFF